MRPRELRAWHTPTYELLRSYYRLDPAVWHDAAEEHVGTEPRACCG
ncbi:hypothetical protein J4558_19520 [Leptolyngbya sp. 15MV]|nr:hypothetical protein J4558_19520 [Leptolyngbya sp. 15MV]